MVLPRDNLSKTASKTRANCVSPASCLRLACVSPASVGVGACGRPAGTTLHFWPAGEHKYPRKCSED